MRQFGVPDRGLGVGACTGLVVAQTRHLGPHEGAVGDVVVAQRGGCGVAGELGVRVEEGRAEVGATEPFQVHRQERDVVEGVDVAQVVVEVEAVQDARAVMEAEHVVGDQIAVSVHDPSVRASSREELAPSGHEPGRQPIDLVDEAVGERRTLVAAELRDVGPPTPTQRRRAPSTAMPGPRPARVWKAAISRARSHRCVLHRRARQNQGRQPPVGRHATHHEHGLGGLVRAGEPAEAQVHVRRDPAVELQLPA